MERGLCETRSKAQALIIAGQILVNDEPVSKPGHRFEVTIPIRVKGETLAFVSRGGLKLEKAVQEFGISMAEKVCLDVGASTGGFTDVLLQGGAAKVFCLDVGHNQLDWKIRNDSRTVVLEGMNARNLQFEDLGERVDLVVMDVSFISIRLILPALLPLLRDETSEIVTLVKPQFEAGREQVGKGGIVRDPAVHKQVLEEVQAFGSKIGLACQGIIESPITGAQGNKEYLAHWRVKA